MSFTDYSGFEPGVTLLNLHVDLAYNLEAGNWPMRGFQLEWGENDASLALHVRALASFQAYSGHALHMLTEEDKEMRKLAMQSTMSDLKRFQAGLTKE